MTEKKSLGDLDLQLFLSGAMPLYPRILLLLATLVDGNLRNRLRAVKESNRIYRQEEMSRLEARLFPASPRIFKVTPVRRANWSLAWAGSLALLTLCALPFMYPNEALVAKGRGLGVNLFVKGDTAYRVEKLEAKISFKDTLQVVPIGSEKQHLVLLGWDRVEGIVRLYPKVGNRAHPVSPTEPPPGLLLQDMDESRLICISSTSPFNISDAMKLVNLQIFAAPLAATASHLENGLYIQIFTITRKTASR